MKAVRIHTFGPPSVMVIEDLPRPTPGPGEVLVHVAAAGVGPWDALIREHKSVVHSVLPLILGSDVSGVIEAVGPGVSAFQVGDDIYGVTNPDFCGAYTEYALASAAMVARKPHGLSPVEAASVPVVAVTAWQMLFEYAQAHPGQTVLIHGAAGNVGAYAVQLASQAGCRCSRPRRPQTRRLSAVSVPRPSLTTRPRDSKKLYHRLTWSSTRWAETPGNVRSGSSSRAACWSRSCQSLCLSGINRTACEPYFFSWR